MPWCVCYFIRHGPNQWSDPNLVSDYYVFGSWSGNRILAYYRLRNIEKNVFDIFVCVMHNVSGRIQFRQNSFLFDLIRIRNTENQCCEGENIEFRLVAHFFKPKFWLQLWPFTFNAGKQISLAMFFALWKIHIGNK